MHRPLQLLNLLTQIRQITPRHCITPYTMLHSEYRHTNTQCCSQGTNTMITCIMLQSIYTHSVLVRIHTLSCSQSTHTQQACCVSDSRHCKSPQLCARRRYRSAMVKQHKHECPTSSLHDLMIAVCVCSQDVSMVQILQPSFGYAPSFSSCMSVLLLAGLTGTKPAPPLPPPPAGPQGEAGAMAGAAPSSPAVERALTGLVCRASMDLSRLLQIAYRTARCLGS